jgi:hypothetical protein
MEALSLTFIQFYLKLDCCKSQFVFRQKSPLSLLNWQDGTPVCP